MYTDSNTYEIFKMSNDSIIKSATTITAGAYAAGLTAKFLVPFAMATFGTVVPGVGTLHAAGGVASLLQCAAAHTLTNSLLLGAGSVPVLYIRSKL